MRRNNGGVVALKAASNLKLRTSVRVLASTGCKNLDSEFRRLGFNEKQSAAEVESGRFFILKLKQLPKDTAVLLESSLACVKSRFSIQPESADTLSLIVAGTSRQFMELKSALGGKSPEDQQIADYILEAINNHSRRDFTVPYPGGILDLSRKTAIMGVLNVTPDSFSDGGDFFLKETAIKQALEMEQAGADIIDIGGESTRPGSDPVSTDEEIRRVVPVIEAVRPRIRIPISIDTYKPEVACEALATGAKIINDVSGLRENDKMGEIAAENKVPLILMHMKDKPKTMQDNPVYEDLIQEIYTSLLISVEKALASGIEKNRIIVDPGIGFGKSYDDNLVIIDRLHELKSLGMPICIGASRKAFIGAALGLPEPKERLVGTISASVLAARNGARIIRIHDVVEAAQALKIADAIATGRLSREV